METPQKMGFTACLAERSRHDYTWRLIGQRVELGYHLRAALQA